MHENEDLPVSVADLSRLVQDNNLGGEVLSGTSGVVLGVGGEVSSLDVLDGNVLFLVELGWVHPLDAIFEHLKNQNWLKGF